MLVAFWQRKSTGQRKGWQIANARQRSACSSQVVLALIPAVLTLSIFLFVNAGLTGFSTNLHDIIYKVIQTPLLVAWEVVSGQL